MSKYLSWTQIAASQNSSVQYILVDLGIVNYSLCTPGRRSCCSCATASEVHIAKVYSNNARFERCGTRLLIDRGEDGWHGGWESRLGPPVTRGIRSGLSVVSLMRGMFRALMREVGMADIGTREGGGSARVGIEVEACGVNGTRSCWELGQFDTMAWNIFCYEGKVVRLTFVCYD